jgi:hypothetical protein
MREASPGMSRSFPPITRTNPGNPFTPKMARSRGPGNLLNALGPTPAALVGVDPRLTSQGTTPAVTLPAYVPYGTLDPRNVFDMRPA